MVTAPQALLLVQADVDPEHEASWNRWYNDRHVPDRRAVKGFGFCARWQSDSGAPGIGVAGPLPKYLATYDLDTTSVLSSAGYQTLSQPPRFSEDDRAMLRRFRNTNRVVCEQVLRATRDDAADPTSAGGLLVVGLVPEPSYEEEYNAWYDEEHIPYLIQVPGVLRARRFRAVEGEPRYLAVYELESPEVRQSEAFARAANTPWSARMRRHCERKLTGLYRPLAC